MHKKLILLTALLLTGCGSKRSKEEQELKQATQVPVLVCEKDGVRLYKIYDSTDGMGSSYVYFTVPIGSTYWNTTDGEGVDHHRVAGPQTAAPKKK